jgi:hypothetical protein
MRFGARGSVAARLVLISWAHLPMLYAVTPSEGQRIIKICLWFCSGYHGFDYVT